MTFKTLFVAITSTIIVAILEHLWNVDDGQKIEWVIEREEGVIGCLAKRKFEEMRTAKDEERREVILKLVEAHECFLYKKGEVVEGEKKFCPKNGDMNEIELFSTARFLFGRIYLPCFAFYEELNGAKN